MAYIIFDLDDSEISNERVSLGRKIFNLIRTSILNLNVFEETYNDAHGRRNEIIATRVYVIVMIIGLVVIIFYTSLVGYTLTYRVRK